MTRNERLTATVEGPFVVFLIGLRINNILPLTRAMPRMLADLQRQPQC